MISPRITIEFNGNESYLAFQFCFAWEIRELELRVLQFIIKLQLEEVYI